MRINIEDENWLRLKHQDLSDTDLEGLYLDYLRDYDQSILDSRISQRIIASELIIVPRNAVESARSVLTNVMDTMVNKIGNTSWIEDSVKTILLWKARDMALLTAYPDEYANETMVEKFYERFPDVDAEFFSPYVASRRLLTIRIFRRHANAILRPATPNALYGFQENIIKVYAGILQPPVYIEGAPAAINYGGLGQVAGHEMMHAYDVKGIALDQKGRPLDNLKPTASMRAYEEKVLCLRASYERIGRETEKAIREMLDTMRIPETSQKPTEKAAALYQACIRLGNDPHGSQILINKDDEDWIKNQHKKYDSAGLARFYMSYLNVYNSSLDSAPLVARIIQSELTVGAFLVTLRNSWSLTFYNTLDQLGYRTRGYVSQGRWVSAISQATANVYNGSTFVLMKQNSTSLVVFLLDRNRISLEDSRLLMSWSLVHQLLPLAYGQMMDSELIELPDRRDRVASLCYQHIIGVMALAVSERYFSTR
ncbi:hypothetical protein V5799_026300 [Amblyomma americanum]|uniref:Peptidase M13 C-terminal domain-containing protein n=1 Tax=Amblyomma americanum TaxID=6943 RepID=A0AAQ4DIZ3_AMBAM